MSAKKIPGVRRKDNFVCEDLNQIRVQDGFNGRASLGDLTELKDSIREIGLLAPLVVWRDPEKEAAFLLIDGERRLTACRELRGEGFDIHVPCVVAVGVKSEEDAAVAMATANIQRKSFDPIEEASLVVRFQSLYNWSDDQVAQKLGKSAPWVAQRRSLLDTTKEIQQKVSKGEIGLGHAVDLAKLPRSKQDATLAEVEAEAAEVAEKSGKTGEAKKKSLRSFMAKKLAKKAGRKMRPRVNKVEDMIRVIEANVEEMVPRDLVVDALAYAMGELPEDDFRANLMIYFAEEDLVEENSKDDVADIDVDKVPTATYVSSVLDHQESSKSSTVYSAAPSESSPSSKTILC